MKKRLLSIVIVIVVLVVIGGLSAAFLFEDKHVAQGRRLYAYYCAHCHGAKGRGDGFNARNLDPPPSDHADSKDVYMANKTNQELFDVDNLGGRENGKSPFMPPFGNVLSEEELWSLVAYLRTLHPNKAPKIDFSKTYKTERPVFPTITRADFDQKKVELQVDDPEAVERLVRIGERIFEEKYGCTACHRVNGTGGQVGPFLDRTGFRLQASYEYRWIKNPQSIKPDTKMPNFGLPDRDAMAITLYLESLKGEAGQTRKEVSLQRK